MKKLALILLGAAIAFPLGVLTRDAVAQKRVDFLEGRNAFHDVGFVHVEKADAAIADALAEIGASRRAAEPVWSDNRVSEARDALMRAQHDLDVIVDGIYERRAALRVLR